MCGKRCTIECAAKEPASAPRKGGGTANFGVDIPRSPMHPRTCPLGYRRLVAQLLERMIDHHAGASKSGSTASVGHSTHLCQNSATNKHVLFLGVAKESFFKELSLLYLHTHGRSMSA